MPSNHTIGAPFPDPRFVDLSPVGHGAMGFVHRAFDTAREQYVALKTLPGLDPDQVFWLKSEFRSLADVRHPNLVELYELRVTEATCFFTMELIEGIDFDRFVAQALERPAELTGETAFAAIEDLIVQLAHGIQAIHDAGKLHRDIKPSNVLVTCDRRVVLLDFGLTIPVERISEPSERRVLTGSPLYMAPEQVNGDIISAAADWYAMGVVLFEAFTGTPPYTGSMPELVWQKSRRAPDLRSRSPLVPDHIALLVSSLLDPDPAQRPSSARIVSIVGPDVQQRPNDTSGRERFVGRLDEIDQLHESFANARSGAVVVHVQGESGIGKTALIEHFVDRLGQQERALVLRGRCHPRESVPYKALDGVIDNLTQVLVHDVGYQSLVRSARGRALERLFPVLARLGDAALGPMVEAPSDPVEARRHGAEALAAILGAIALTRPLVIWIDDLQWGDSDSASVLRSVLATAKLPSLLVVLSYRSENVERSPLLYELAGAPLEGRQTRRIQLQVDALPANEATQLARILVHDPQATSVAADVAREAGGSPFFIRELARHTASVAGGTSPKPTRLEEIVSDRIASLPADARRLLELVSLAATTLTTRTAVDATGTAGVAFSSLRMLESAGFVRLAPLGPEQAVEPYHDRIRESVVAHIAPPELPERHRALARVLEHAVEPDPEALLTHHLGAGDAEKALLNARVAAQRASSALAFDRAAALYQTALGLVAESGERLTLTVQLADALNNGGRTGEAADRFLEAAQVAESSAAEDAQLRTLRRRASECLLRSGRSTEGRAMLWDILRSVDAPLPRSEGDALRRATFARLPLLLGQLPAARVQKTALSPAARERLEILWAAAICLSWEPVTSSFFRACYIREALPTNDPLLVAGALGAEAASQGILRWRYFRRRGERLVLRMEEIASELGDAYTTAHAASVRACNAWFSGRWRDALAYGDREIELLKQHCYGVSWELAVAHMFSLSALSFLGEMGTLSTRLEAAVREFKERGDHFAVRNLHLGQHNFCTLAMDRPDEALERAEEMRRSMPEDRFEVGHYHYVVLVTQCHLYRGDPLSAWDCIQEAWPRLKAAQFLQLEFTRIELVHLRARAAVALGIGSPRGATSRGRGAPSSRDLLRLARHAARAIRRSEAPPAAPFAASLDAAVALSHGNDDVARASLERAASGFSMAEMGLHAAVSRLALGKLAGGDEGDKLAESALVTLAAQTARPGAIAATLLPGTKV